MRDRNIFKDIPIADNWLTEYLVNRQNEACSQLLNSTKLTELIYNGFSGRYLDNGIEVSPVDLKNLMFDLFVALFSPVLRRKDDGSIKFRQKNYNKPVLDKIIGDEDFNTLKHICEDKAVLSFETAKEFTRSFSESIKDKPDLIDTECLNRVIELNKQAENAISEIKSGKVQNPKRLLWLYNRVRQKLTQAENLKAKAEAQAVCYISSINDDIKKSLKNAVLVSQEDSFIMSAWGTENGKQCKMESDKGLLDYVKNSKTLLEIAKSLGRYKEIVANKRKNAFSYGRGEKYDLTLGNDITNCLSGELGLLGTAQTEILFMRKYEQKRLQQYRKRNRIVKGKGDFIVLLDESGSTRIVQSWAKAFALAMLDIASKDNRKCAIVHFSSSFQIKVDLFEPKKYTTDDVINAAEHFFSGGTDFETPLKEALKLMENGFENADITIITDGECVISDDFAKEFKAAISGFNATVTGILLDKGSPCGDSLVPFCDKIYHSKDITEDEIAIDILNRKAS